MVAAVAVSHHRNVRDIEAFEDHGLDELKFCIPSHNIGFVRRKLNKMGWNLKSNVEDEKTKGHSIVHVAKANDDSESLKQVLHALNRSHILPVSPLNLRSENGMESN